MKISQKLQNKAVSTATKMYIDSQLPKIGRRGVHNLKESMAAFKGEINEATKGLGIFQKLDAMHHLCDLGIENGGGITFEHVEDIMTLREKLVGTKRATVEKVVVDSTKEQQAFPVTRVAGAGRENSAEIENGLA